MPAMIARVVVDVVARQTDRVYDYRIPTHLSAWIRVGSRVEVPFGPRVVQGFVVEIASEEEAERVELKQVERVLDLVAPLNEDLVALSAVISKAYVCPRILALQAMLPAALKARYRHWIVAGTQQSASGAGVLMLQPLEEQLLAFVRKRERVEKEQLLQAYPSSDLALKQLLKMGLLSEQVQVGNRLEKKTVLTVFPINEEADWLQRMEALPTRAAAMRAVCVYLAAHPRPIAMRDLIQATGASSSSVKNLAAKGWLQLRMEVIDRDPYGSRQFERTEPLALSVEQQSAYDRICQAMHEQRPDEFLLHGITGSGKTEVYLQCIEVCLALGRQSIVLVPEISLTPQMVERFKGRFGDEVAVLHSRLSTGERYDEWRKIREGRCRVAVGARSAIFAPFDSLGLIIIDEEHESSYKQEESPKYHARHVALLRGRQHRAPVVLGSATPSLESYYRASQDPDAHYLPMASRVADRPLPQVQIVDMRAELSGGNRAMFSRVLQQAIAEKLERREQIVLLLNRRGHSTFVLCRSCGYTALCPHCEIALTYHKSAGMLRCHYCGYGEKEPLECPECGSNHIRYFGTGTQRVEEELYRYFPGCRVIRMDVDTTSEKGSHEKWLNQFRKREADILLGTQMVAKGLDFPHVTLVGVIAADTALHLPDFRSAEKTFQLLTQVAGRAGRHELRGEVVVQTYNPEHYSIQLAAGHDFLSFAQRELMMRRQLKYPPFCELLLVTFSHERVELLVKAGEQFKSAVQRGGGETFGLDRDFFEVWGPVASPVARRKDRYRFQCMVKYRHGEEVPSWVRQIVMDMEAKYKAEQLQISVDVNPQVML